jgi:hypothetical protein
VTVREEQNDDKIQPQRSQENLTQLESQTCPQVQFLCSIIHQEVLTRDNRLIGGSTTRSRHLHKTFKKHDQRGMRPTLWQGIELVLGAEGSREVRQNWPEDMTLPWVGEESVNVATIDGKQDRSALKIAVVDSGN